MRIELPAKIKMLSVAIIAAVFISSLIFAYIMLTSDHLDSSRVYTYAAIFAAVFIILNVSLLIIGVWALRRTKAAAKCAACGSALDGGTCPKCTPADAAAESKDNTIRPKG